MKFNAINVTNVINGQINKAYNTTLPIVDKHNFSDMADQLTSRPVEVINAWSEALLNLVKMQVIMNKAPLESYFKNLYKADTTSENIQLLMVDLIPAKVFNPNSDAQDFFEDAKAEIGTQYIQSVLREHFDLSVNEDILIASFASDGTFNDFLGTLVTKMYDSMEHYDMQEVKKMLSSNIEDGNFYIVAIDKPVDKDTSLAFTNKVKYLSEDMRVENNNEYNLSHFYTHIPTSDGVIMTTTDVVAATETYSLAWAFNQGYLDLKSKGQFITIPSTGLAGGKIFGGYFDRDVLQLRYKKGFPKMTSQYFANKLTLKQWLHVQKILAVSYFNNAVFFASTNDVGITSATLDTRNGSANVNKGARTDIYVSKVVIPSGKVGDKFGKFSVAGYNEDGESVVLSSDTYIDETNGRLYVGKDETANKLTVTWTSHIDNDVTATKDITVNGN